jgi:hypothetical protein
MDNPILQAALDYRAAGISVIPVSPTTKKPKVKWSGYQDPEKLPDEAEFRTMFNRANALAAICGQVSGNLEALDFDFQAELFEPWRELVNHEAPGLVERLPLQKSQHDGRHIGFRCPGMKISGNKKLAQKGVDVTDQVLAGLTELGVDPTDAPAVKKALVGMRVKAGGKDAAPIPHHGGFVAVITLVETRGEGGYLLVDPSPGYKWLRGSPKRDIPEVTPEEREVMIRAAMALNEWVNPNEVEGLGWNLPKEARRPGDDYNGRGPVAEILEKHGWQPVGARGLYQHYRRPGKDRGQSASLIDEKWFRVFSSNAYPFEAETTYSPFGVYVLLEHDGDFVKAAGELAKQGYGERQKKQKEQAEQKPSQQDILLTIAAAVELFHTPDEDVYGIITINEHRETWAIRSKGFRRYLAHEFYKIEGKGPQAEALSSALQVLEARAQFDGPERPVWVRVAEHEGAIYLDLGNDSCEAVKITPNDWELVSDPPVCFRRTRSMTALPYPVRGGNVMELRQFLNIASDADFILLVAFLISALRPRGPYPISVLNGEQGSAKSTTARCLGNLIDPSTSPLRSTPRDVRDLMIAATNSWVLGFDNLSGVSDWLSDAFCRLSTGGGFSTRELYTDREEVIFEATRPIILNGIDALTNRQDLADRSLIFNLPQIEKKKRRSEKEFWKEFGEARPRILGALLATVSMALRNIDTVKLPDPLRMADFSLWVAAAEPALPWPAGSFMEAYAHNRAEAVELSLEADCVAVTMREFMADKIEWSGKPSQLYEELEKLVPENTKRSKLWPKAANKLSNRLTRAATFLRVIGLNVENGWSKTGEREIKIRRVPKGRESTVGTVGTVGSEETCGFSSHDTTNEPWERKAGNHAPFRDTHDTHDTLHTPDGLEELEL